MGKKQEKRTDDTGEINEVIEKGGERAAKSAGKKTGGTVGKKVTQGIFKAAAKTAAKVGVPAATGASIGSFGGPVGSAVGAVTGALLGDMIFPDQRRAAAPSSIFPLQASEAARNPCPEVSPLHDLGPRDCGAGPVPVASAP